MQLRFAMRRRIIESGVFAGCGVTAVHVEHPGEVAGRIATPRPIEASPDRVDFARARVDRCGSRFCRGPSRGLVSRPRVDFEAVQSRNRRSANWAGRELGAMTNARRDESRRAQGLRRRLTASGGYLRSLDFGAERPAGDFVGTGTPAPNTRFPAPPLMSPFGIRSDSVMTSRGGGDFGFIVVTWPVALHAPCQRPRWRLSRKLGANSLIPRR